VRRLRLGLILLYGGDALKYAKYIRALEGKLGRRYSAQKGVEREKTLTS